MREPIENMLNRILTALRKAGRNKRQLNRALTKLESDIRQQTGEKDKRWTEEYYLYLLETYAQAMDAAVQAAVKLEEYEWAEVLTARKVRVNETISLMSVEK